LPTACNGGPWRKPGPAPRGRERKTKTPAGDSRARSCHAGISALFGVQSFTSFAVGRGVVQETGPRQPGSQSRCHAPAVVGAGTGADQGHGVGRRPHRQRGKRPAHSGGGGEGRRSVRGAGMDAPGTRTHASGQRPLGLGEASCSWLPRTTLGAVGNRFARHRPGSRSSPADGAERRRRAPETEPLGHRQPARWATDEEAAAWFQDRTGRRVMDRGVGRRLFTDGLERAVYEDAEGRQYVLGPDGERMYGQWLPPADEPAVVETRGEAG
jgi:hypothetical protein